ncbi:TPA: cysteine hydrolase, partial [Vibrio cholerae]
MKSAVLVIDVQSILFDPPPQPFERNEVLTRINTITDWARQKD